MYVHFCYSLVVVGSNHVQEMLLKISSCFPQYKNITYSSTLISARHFWYDSTKTDKSTFEHNVSLRQPL